MFKRLFGIVFIAVLALAGDGGYDTNAKIKAVYIYNFAKYVEWPKDYRDQAFVIGILGDSPLIRELEGMSASKKIYDQNIQVKKFGTVNDLTKCHILYVPSDCKIPLSTILGKIDGFSTLLVTDTPGFATKGSAINFVIMDNRQKFELNGANAEKYNLKVSNSLEALAILVN